MVQIVNRPLRRYTECMLNFNTFFISFCFVNEFAFFCYIYVITFWMLGPARDREICHRFCVDVRTSERRERERERVCWFKKKLQCFVISHIKPIWSMESIVVVCVPVNHHCQRTTWLQWLNIYMLVQWKVLSDMSKFK